SDEKTTTITITSTNEGEPSRRARAVSWARGPGSPLPGRARARRDAPLERPPASRAARGPGPRARALAPPRLRLHERAPWARPRGLARPGVRAARKDLGHGRRPSGSRARHDRPRRGRDRPCGKWPADQAARAVRGRRLSLVRARGTALGPD